MKGVKKPSWSTTTKELNKWQKVHGVYMFKGNVCQVVIVDLDDPIGILMQKPLRVVREEGVITGAFCLNDALVTAARRAKQPPVKPFYFVAAYVRSAKCFVYQANGAQLPMILNNPDIRYIEGADRLRVRKVLNDE